MLVAVMNERSVARMTVAHLTENGVAHVCPARPAQPVEPKQHRRHERAAGLRLVDVDESIGKDHIVINTVARPQFFASVVMAKSNVVSSRPEVEETKPCPTR